MARSNAHEARARASFQNATRAREELPIGELPIEVLQSAVRRNGIAIQDGSARRR